MNNREAISTLILEQTAMLSPEVRLQFILQMDLPQKTYDEVTCIQLKVIIMEESKFKKQLIQCIQDRKEQILEQRLRDHGNDVRKYVQQKNKFRQEIIKGEIQDQVLRDYIQSENFKIKAEFFKFILAILAYLISGFSIFSYLLQSATLAVPSTSTPTDNPFDPKVQIIGISILCLLAIAWLILLIWLIKLLYKYYSTYD